MNNSLKKQQTLSKQFFNGDNLINKQQIQQTILSMASFDSFIVQKQFLQNFLSNHNQKIQYSSFQVNQLYLKFRQQQNKKQRIELNLNIFAIYLFSHQSQLVQDFLKLSNQRSKNQIQSLLNNSFLKNGLLFTIKNKNIFDQQFYLSRFKQFYNNGQQNYTIQQILGIVKKYIENTSELQILHISQLDSQIIKQMSQQKKIKSIDSNQKNISKQLHQSYDQEQIKLQQQIFFTQNKSLQKVSDKLYNNQFKSQQKSQRQQILDSKVCILQQQSLQKVLDQSIAKYSAFYKQCKNIDQQKILIQTIKSLTKQLQSLKNLKNNQEINQKEINIILPLINQSKQKQKMRQNKIQFIFIFYCKKMYNLGKFATFEDIERQCHIMNMVKFMRFCKDFKINQVVDRLFLVDAYKKQAFLRKELDFNSFLQLLRKIAKKLYPENSMDKLYSFLEIDQESKVKEKMKLNFLPFLMKQKVSPKFQIKKKLQNLILVNGMSQVSIREELQSRKLKRMQRNPKNYSLNIVKNNSNQKQFQVSKVERYFKTKPERKKLNRKKKIKSECKSYLNQQPKKKQVQKKEIIQKFLNNQLSNVQLYDLFQNNTNDNKKNTDTEIQKIVINNRKQKYKRKILIPLINNQKKTNSKQMQYLKLIHN